MKIIKFIYYILLLKSYLFLVLFLRRRCGLEPVFDQPYHRPAHVNFILLSFSCLLQFLVFGTVIVFHQHIWNPQFQIQAMLDQFVKTQLDKKVRIDTFQLVPSNSILCPQLPIMYKDFPSALKHDMRCFGVHHLRVSAAQGSGVNIAVHLGLILFFFFFFFFCLFRHIIYF